MDGYRLRWLIEQLFRILKKPGLDLESSQLEQADSLMKLTILAVQAAVTSLPLVLSRDEHTERAISEVFNQPEILLLRVLLGSRRAQPGAGKILMLTTNWLGRPGLSHVWAAEKAISPSRRPDPLPCSGLTRVCNAIQGVHIIK